MSSTTGQNKIALDHYPTPVAIVERLMIDLQVRHDDTFLEPCRADGNIYDAVKLPESQKSWAEIRDGVDYLETKFDKQDLIITNPPFSLTTEFLTKSMSELKEDGTLVYLQRVNFLGSIKRIPFWREIGFPNKTPVVIPRPSFIKGGSDSTEYMWYIWDFGNRFPHVDYGMSHMVTSDRSAWWI